MRYSENIGACSMSVRAQHIVSRLGDAEIVNSLSLNPRLHPEVADTLLSFGGSVKMRALGVASDTERVVSSLKKNGIHAQYAARNKGADPDVLAKCLSSRKDGIAISALINGSTPETERRKLPVKRIEELVNVGGSLANSVVRSFEVVSRNEWLRGYCGPMSNNLRRGVTGLADISLDEVRRIEEGTYSHWESHRNNPARNGVDLKTLTTEELVEAGSVACDIEALNRSDMTESHAGSILLRKRAPVEPHVLSRLIERFGVSLLSYGGRLSVSRCTGAAWLTPVVGYSVGHYHRMPWRELQKAADELGENAEAWTVYSRLRHSWSGEILELAQICTAI